MKWIEKIDVSDIIKRHLMTLSDASTKKATVGDFMLFLFFPLFVTFILIKLELYLEKEFVDILCTSLSIFIGLFFNVIVLIFDLVGRTERNSVKNDLLKELLINISFEIFISVFCIVFAVLSLSKNGYIKLISNSITFFLTSLFLTTLLMILKRTFSVFIKEVENPNGVSSKY